MPAPYQRSLDMACKAISTSAAHHQCHERELQPCLSSTKHMHTVILRYDGGKLDSEEGGGDYSPAQACYAECTELEA